jgi:4-amino-4-deoxy-L-arabinose transferase-like glycosyltransferase
MNPPLATSKPAAGARLQLLLILLGGLFIYGWRLSAAPLAGTEPLRALVGHQMVLHTQGSTLLVPRLYGELYLRKPPLMPWILAGVETLAGRGNELVWRLPSAVGSALLAVILALWAGRWFGPRARAVAGFGCLGLVALWAQDRGADIDALNTFASVVTACCIVELAVGPPRRRWPWALLLAAASGAVWLLKGPGGLPTVLGTLLACALVRAGRRVFRQPALWIALAGGVGMFGLWLALMLLRVRALHLAMDTSGAAEAENRLLLHLSASQIGLALLAPARVLLYTLPVSLGLPLALQVADRLHGDDPRRHRIHVVAAAVLLSLGVGFLGGITNPRYSYVPAPLLAILLGAAAAVALDTPGIDFAGARHVLAGGVRVVCLLWAGAVLLLGALTPRLIARVDPREHMALPVAWLVGAGVAAVAVACWAALPAKRPLAARAWAAAGLTVLLGIPFAVMKNAERTRYSGRAVGAELRAIVGNGAVLSAAAVVRDLPQVFYYAGVSVESFGEHGVGGLAATAGPRWILLEEQSPDHLEYTQMRRLTPERVRQVRRLRLADEWLYLIWVPAGDGAGGGR